MSKKTCHCGIEYECKESVLGVYSCTASDPDDAPNLFKAYSNEGTSLFMYTCKCSLPIVSVSYNGRFGKLTVFFSETLR